MTFFSGFPTVNYKFGNEKDYNIIQNLSLYIDIIDKLKDNTTAYTFYNLYDGERPDQVSQMLYGTTDYYWTFFLLNDKLKESGWPRSLKSLEAYVKKKYTNTTITTRDYFYDKFRVGDLVTTTRNDSNQEEIVTRVIKTNSNIGTFTVPGSLNYIDGEMVKLVGLQSGKFITVHSSTVEYNAVRHYKDTEGIVDIDPTIGPGSNLTAVTNLDHYKEQNDINKKIKIFKPEIVSSVFSSYKKTLRENR